MHSGAASVSVRLEVGIFRGFHDGK
jgi:hypothetical protein